MFRVLRYTVGIAVGLCLAAAAVAAPPQVTGVRVGVYPAKTRIVFDVTAPLTLETFVLPNPFRVVVDLPEVTWAPALRDAPSGGLITGMRFGLFKPGTSRVVLDSAGPVRVGKSFILPPARSTKSYRVVLDIAATTNASFMSSYRKPMPQEAAAADIPVPVRKKPLAHERPLIMIDPGHGGIDPGAESRSGVWEKDIVLSFARELRRQLLASGKFRAALTRDRDVFVRLRDRIAVAREAGAHLFVSVHADTVGNPSVRGASVYTLSEQASDAEAATLASRENKSDVIAGVDLNDRPDEVVNILIDLAQRETMNESAVFAKILVDELGKVRQMLRNTHRFAGFAVLKAPDIPSVLVELGYLSNRYDERSLRDPARRQRIASSMVEAIGQYFQRQQAFNRP